MIENIGKNVSKNLRSKYVQTLYDHATQFATDALKTSSKKSIQKYHKQLVIWLEIKLLKSLKNFTTK